MPAKLTEQSATVFWGVEAQAATLLEQSATVFWSVDAQAATLLEQSATAFWSVDAQAATLLEQSATVFWSVDAQAATLLEQSATVFWDVDAQAATLLEQSATVFWGVEAQAATLLEQSATVFFAAAPPRRILSMPPNATGGDIRSLLYGIDEDIDYAQDALGLVMDDGLETAVIISLFTDRRADPDDVIPDGSQDRRGWWGDDFNADPADRIGSHLWLLHREKQLSSVLKRAEYYAEESLAWLVADGVAQSVVVTAGIPRKEMLGLDIAIQRPRHPVAQYRFEVFWGR